MFDKLFISEENKFYPENQDGNIEYKLRLDTKNDLGVKKLTTQMMWRLNEGYESTGIREAHYLLGVYDNGDLGKLTEEQLQNTINVFKDSIKQYNIEIQSEFIRLIEGSYIYYALVVQNNNLENIKEKNIIIIGDPQSGKTSLISNICYDANVRDQILKHVHEKINGITTDIKKEIIGIKNNKIINYVDYCGWDEIAKNADYIINIYDIPVINFKTVINYIIGIMPEHMIIISKKEDYSDDVKFYIEFCEFYKVSYNVINSNDLLKYNKKIFTEIFININNIYKENMINNSESIFRINDYYDIPERGYIVSGIQKNNSFSVGDICFLNTSDEVYKIKIKSIHKKNINFKNINSQESGSINFDLIDKISKIKLSKNAYITNMLDNKNINTINIITNKKIDNGVYNMRLYNGNTNQDMIGEIEDSIINFESPIKLHDKNLIISIGLNSIYLCTVKY
jgi:GTPase